MKVVITGGGGFLGKKLARRILQQGTLADADGKQQKVSELLLFDVGQAYRQLHDCDNARSYYSYYLRVQPTADNRKQVERFIADMEACAAGTKVSFKGDDAVMTRKLASPVKTARTKSRKVAVVRKEISTRKRPLSSAASPARTALR